MFISYIIRTYSQTQNSQNKQLTCISIYALKSLHENVVKWSLTGACSTLGNPPLYANEAGKWNSVVKPEPPLSLASLKRQVNPHTKNQNNSARRKWVSCRCLVSPPSAVFFTSEQDKNVEVSEPTSHCTGFKSFYKCSNSRKVFKTTGKNRQLRVGTRIPTPIFYGRSDGNLWKPNQKQLANGFPV